MAGQSSSKWTYLATAENPCSELEPFLDEIKTAKRVILFRKKQAIYQQGEFADSVYYVQHGTVKLNVLASDGKEAVLSLLGPGSFFGEACLMDGDRHVNTATALTDCAIVRITKPCMVEALGQRGNFSQIFLAHLLNRNREYEQAICEHIVESSERRLARVLLRFSRCCGRNGGGDAYVLPKLSHETLAEMIGTTRPRVSSFMKKFERLGLIDYEDGLRVYCSRLQAAILGEG
jgi:CRP/FNR family transcriptional regulator, cyclic AMP receptor protein